VVSQGNSAHSKQSLTPFVKAQLHIWQNLFSLATQPVVPFGQLPFCILGHFSHAIPQTPIRILSIASFQRITLQPLFKNVDFVHP
jgi:hypothetical protein